RRQEDERERREYRCDTRTRDRPRRHIDSRGTKCVTGRGHDPVRRRYVADELSDDRDQRREERRVKPLERKPQIPEGVPREIWEVLDDETRIGDVCGLDASAVARELSGEEWGDQKRLNDEEGGCRKQIHREPGPRCGSDAPSMSGRLSSGPPPAPRMCEVRPHRDVQRSRALRRA